MKSHLNFAAMQRIFTLVLGAVLSVTTAFATSTGFTVEQFATSEYGTTYRLYATFDDPGDWVTSVYGLAGDEGNIPMSILAEGTSSIYHTENAFALNPNYGQEVNPLFLGMVPDLVYDSWLTVGVLDNTGSAGPQGAGMEEAFVTFNQGIGFADCGGAWFVASPSGPAAEWQAGDDLKVLLAQITMTDDEDGNIGHFSFQLNVQWRTSTGATSYYLGEGMSSSDFIVSASGCTDPGACNYTEAATEDDGSCEFTSCAGCTDAAACNYDSSATIDNDSCVLPNAADCEFCDGAAIALADADGDGVCDADEVVGCLDETACNYDDAATDAGSCDFATEACEVCEDGSVVLLDDDGDGVCNADETAGCTNAGACNYSASATDDDGSCEFTSCAGCLDNSACNYDTTWTLADNTQCDYASCLGCTDDQACNYDADATIDDDSCDFSSCLGCTDDSACNYDEAASIPDGTCTYPDQYYDCNGDCLLDFDGDGICNELEILGCTDDTACNYNAAATDNEGCEYAPLNGDCNTVCDGDFDGDGFCDNLEVAGCTSSTATNYNATATDDDGTCVWDDPYFTGLSYEIVGHGTIGDASTYRVYAEFNTDEIEMQACFGTDDWNWDVSSTAPFYQNPTGGLLGHSINPLFYAAIPEMEYDSWLALGAGPGDAPGPADVGLDAFTGDFADNGGSFSANTVVGASIYFTPGASAFAFPQAGRVLLGQFTTEGVVTVKYNFQYRDMADETHQVTDLNLTFPANAAGCTDASACNYDASAEFSTNDVCVYPDACDDCSGETDGTGTVIDNDADNDGVCDANEITGCTDETACNYDAAPTTDTDNELCVYPTGCQSCSGETDGTGIAVNNDADGDGVCDADEITGCTDETACNYDVTSTTDSDNTLCVYPEGCDTCSGESDGTGTIVNNDTDGDGVCDANEIPGCDDAEAVNYSAGATDNDGSCIYGECDDPLACNYVPGTEIPSADACVYPEPFFDCEGNCTGDYEGDGICEGEEIWGCASESALNFDPSATSDDGSCAWGDGLFQGLTYEVVTDHEEGPIAGSGWVTYRVYAQFSTSEIDLVQLFGNEEHPWVIENTAEVYQSSVGGDFGGNIATALFSFFPEVEYDSWLTIGAEPGDYNALNQTGMYAYLPEWNTTGDFNADGAEASISVTPTQSSQGVPDANGRVLLAQITTNGVAHLQYNVLFHPEVGDPITFTDVELTFPTQVAGCTNPAALNYQANANSDDGSCEVEGCMIETALNYDPTANLQDDSCLFGGCTDATADNYDEIANVEDGSCLYTGCFDDQADNYDSQANTGDQDALCEYLGCTNLIAVNFDEGANVDDGSCLISGCYNPEADNYNEDANFGNQTSLCQFWGCTDPDAVNFDSGANFNDGSCDYLGCMESTADNYDPQATINDGSCEWFGCTDADADNYDEIANIDDGSCLFTGCFDSAADNYDLFANTGDQELLCEYWGCMDAFADNYDPGANAGDQEALCEYLGCTDDTADNYDSGANVDDGSCEYLGCIDSNADNFDPGANVDDGSCIFFGCTNLQADNFDPDANTNDGSCLFTGCQDPAADNYWFLANVEGPCEYLGCINPDADNFDVTANTDDGSCIVGGCTYIDAANFNAEATYDDASCQFQTVGCTDATAWNYMEGAIEDNGTCLYGGCTYDIAFNFDPDATVDDGSCEWVGCTDTEAVNFDADATHDDGTCEVVGCLDPDGINFNANATFSGYCEYADVCPGDINGDLSVDVQDLLTFFQYYGTFCE